MVPPEALPAIFEIKGQVEKTPRRFLAVVNDSKERNVLGLSFPLFASNDDTP